MIHNIQNLPYPLFYSIPQVVASCGENLSAILFGTDVTVNKENHKAEDSGSVSLSPADKRQKVDDYVVTSSVVQPRHSSIDPHPWSTPLHVDVHKLISAAAKVGSALIDNNGQTNHSVVACITNVIRNSNVKKFDSSGDSLGVLNANESSRARSLHPFLHFWEQDDHTVQASDWRSRRALYLDSQTVVPAELLKPEPHHYGPTVDENNILQTSSSSSMRSSSKRLSSTKRSSHLHSTQEGRDSLDQSAKSLIHLEPHVLGFRWPVGTYDCYDCSPFSDLSSISEAMVLWQ